MSGDARGDFSGTTVGGGRYELRSLLGEGGMASVHFGYDTVLERPVAIKTLHSELGREASFRERFRREAQSVAKLNHTNIVSVFDSGEDEIDGRSIPYIVMELVDGKPLRQILDEDVAQHGAMPTEKALKITGDVLAALAVSHEMGLVHRDIKPGNVMLTKRGVVKVMDFGIARALQSGVTSMTQTGMVVGTPQYLSPEQALGRGVDARSDLYSVGCMLFELLTGRLPFDGDSPLSVAYQHVQEEPPAPSSINQSLPPAVDALVARALRKNPADRFPTAEAMQDECERVAAAAKGIATPLVISEGPKAHQPTAQPDAFAVFPNATGDPHTPSPYQQAPTPQMNYGPPTPPPNQYQQQPYSPTGYQTPPPTTRPTTPAYRTPPPAPRKSGGNWKPLLIFVGVAAVIGVVLITVIVSMSEKTKQHSGDNTNTVTQHTDSPTDQGGNGGNGGNGDIKMGDPSRTVDPSTCTQASGGFTDNGGKIIMPDLTFKYIDSVKACMDAAGWKYKLQHEDENVWGKGIVMSESPDKYNEFNPKTDVITLIVSTGKSSG
ncbi:protein kinase [Streptantibioticus rubrisoli]|uniref:non-specific serine/threonine protein kinase n=1 Tax=Streptantibioticus rubrisoli TaxID=1387313 RepID=A0ABT1PA45_9ACTN|nr:protein kinase [Streptantibioticus rubrisoli]MCQ4042215.1 protein kinase [Streptantibioticus rubrisoli]